MSVNESGNAQIRELKDLMEDIKKSIKTLESKEMDLSPSLKLQSVEKMGMNKLFEAHLVCPICYEYFIFPTSLHTCGHTFCDYCIYRWKQSQDEDPERIALRDTCPVCRTPIVAIARSTAFENMIETCIEKWGNDCFTSSERRVAREELKTFRKQFLLQRKNEERANEHQSNPLRYPDRNIYDLIFDSSGDFFGIMRPRQVPATEGNDRENPVLNEIRPLDNTYAMDDLNEINPPSELHTSNERRSSTLAVPDSTTHRQLSDSGDIFYNVTRVSNIFNDVNEGSAPLSSTLERNDFQATIEPLSSTTGHNEGPALVPGQPVPEAAAVQTYADIQIDRENDENENSSSSSYGFFNELDQQSNFIQQMVRDFDSESDESWSVPESRNADEWPFGHLNNSIWNRYENRVRNESLSNESFQTSNQQNNSFLSVEEAEDESAIPQSAQIGSYNSEQNSDTFSESNQFLDTSDWLNENAVEPDFRSFDRPVTDNSLGQEILAWIGRQRLENLTQSSFVDDTFGPDLIRVESRIDRSSNGNHEFVTELEKTFEHDATSMNSDDENDYNGPDTVSSASEDDIADNYDCENDLGTSDMINSQRRIVDIDESRSYNSNLRNDYQSGVAPLSQWSSLRRPQLHLSDDWSDLEEPSDDDSRYDLT